MKKNFFGRVLTVALALTFILALMPASKALDNSTLRVWGSTYSGTPGYTLRTGLTSITTGGKTYSMTYGPIPYSGGAVGYIIDLGEYNVNNDTFVLPTVAQLFEVASGTTLHDVSVGGTSKNAGASILLQNGGFNVNYQFKGTGYVGEGGGDPETPPPGSGGPVAPPATWWYRVNVTFSKNCGDTVTNMPTPNPWPYYIGSSKYVKGQTVTTPNYTPIRDGYTFKGWADTAGAASGVLANTGFYLLSPYSGYASSAGVAVSAKTYYATWESNAPAPIEFTLKFEGNPQGGATVSDVPADMTASAAALDHLFTVDADAAPVSNNAGQTFIGWSFNPAATTAEQLTIPATGGAVSVFASEPTQTLHAVWNTAVMRNITYNGNGGTTEPLATVPDGTSFTLPSTGTFTNFTLVGWVIEGGTAIMTGTAIADSDIAYFACWIPLAPISPLN